MSKPAPTDIPTELSLGESSETMYALIRKHPRGGYAVVVGLVEWAETPDVDADNDEHFNTMPGAIRFAREAGFFSIHPECYPPRPTRIVKGL